MLKINTEKNGDALVYKLVGELDMISSKTLEAELKIDGCKELTFDCSKLAYITSAGIRVFVAANRDMNAQGGKLILTNINEAVMEVLKLTGIDKIIEVK